MLSRRRSAGALSKRFRRRLGLEGLERRALLDGEPVVIGPTFDFDDETGVLTVTGTGNDDTVSASVVGDENPTTDPVNLDLRVEVVVGGNTFTWTGPLRAVTHINFNLLEGNDTLRVERAVPQPITVDAGEGNDSAHAGGGSAAMTGGLGDDNLVGGPDADRIDGGWGNDAIDGGGGDDALQGGWGNDKIDGSDGNDRMLGDPGDLGSIDAIPVPGGEDEKVEGEVIPRDSLAPWPLADDVMSGGRGDDRMHGMFGSDRLSGDGGSDGIAGGSFNDNVFGGDELNATDLGGLGDEGDKIRGGIGDDRINAGWGDDYASGGEGDDNIQGGWGHDELDGDGGSDVIIGDPGNFGPIDPVPLPDGTELAVEGIRVDMLAIAVAFPGNDIIRGGDQGDRIHGMLGNDKIDGAGGDDGIAGGHGEDAIGGGAGSDRIRGGASDDDIDAGAGDDVVSGGDGNDIIQGGWNNDHLGGDGGDDVIIGDPGDMIRIDAIPVPDGPDLPVDGEIIDIVPAVVHFADDVISGGEGNDRIHGMIGEDAITGDAGNDGIQGGFGNDKLDGGAGNDKIAGGFLNDSIDAGLGDDWASGGQGDDEIQGGWGNDNLAGDEGNDLVVGDPADFRAVDPVPLPGRVDDLVIAKVIAIPDNVLDDPTRPIPVPIPIPVPLFGNDRISGGDGDDRIHGMLGADAIDAGAGDDGVAGGSGNDVIIGDDGTDKIRGGRGDDRIDAGTGDDAASGGDDNDFIQGGWGNDELYGDGGRDVIVGDPADLSPPEPIPAPFENADVLVAIAEPIDVVPIPVRRGNDTIHGGDDADRIHGMFGNDVVDAGRGHDGVNGGSGDDAIDGNHGHDKLLGGIGDDRINGGFGNDNIAGQAGDDNLQGGWGNDRISGGGGDDAILGDPGDLDSIDDIPLPVALATENRTSLPVEGEIIRDPERPIRLRGNDLIYGDDGNDRIHGMFGNDRIRGGAGRDGIAGGTGYDGIAGGDDGDRIAGGRGRDRLLGGEGDDNLVGGPQSDYIEGASGQDGIFAVDGFVDALCTDDSDDVHADDTDRFVCRINTPAVESVTLRGSRAAWHDAFLARPGDDEMAEAAGGEINIEPDDPITNIPWGGLDQISVAFDRDVAIEQSDLTLGGGNPNSIVAFHYDATDFVATWTFARPIEGNRLRIVLSDRIRPRDSASVGNVSDTLGPFSALVNVVPGDANQDGQADIGDVRTVASRILGSVTGEPDYIDEHDADGNGIVDLHDLLAIRDQRSQTPGTTGVAPAPAADAAIASRAAVDQVMTTLRTSRQTTVIRPRPAAETNAATSVGSVLRSTRGIRSARPIDGEASF